MNANDKLIANNWIYYIAGSSFLIHVPKAANLHSPTRIRRHFWKRGYFSAVFQKVCIHLKRIQIFFAPKSAETMQEKLRPLPSVRCMMNDIILFENHSAVFGIVFLYPQEKNNSAFPKPPLWWRFLKTLRYVFCFPKTPFRSVHTCSCYLRGKSTHTEHLWTRPWIYCYKVVLKLLWSCKDRRNWKSCQLFFAIYRMDGILHLPIFYFILFYFSFITQAPRVSYLQVRSDVSCFFGTPGPDSVGEAFPFVIVQSSLWSLMMSETRKDK